MSGLEAQRPAVRRQPLNSRQQWDWDLKWSFATFSSCFNVEKPPKFVNSPQDVRASPYVKLRFDRKAQKVSKRLYSQLFHHSSLMNLYRSGADI
jgi:hypothetical protein